MFCSRECQSIGYRGDGHPRWKGGSQPILFDLSGWEEKRSEAISRDDGECYVCGMNEYEHILEYGRSFDIHHVKPRRDFFTGDSWGEDEFEAANSLDNLVTVCASCHGIVEGMTWNEIDQLAFKVGSA
jgi:hypothetical protein